MSEEEDVRRCRARQDWCAKDSVKAQSRSVGPIVGRIRKPKVQAAKGKLGWRSDRSWRADHKCECECESQQLCAAGACY